MLVLNGVEVWPPSTWKREETCGGRKYKIWISHFSPSQHQHRSPDSLDRRSFFNIIFRCLLCFNQKRTRRQRWPSSERENVENKTKQWKNFFILFYFRLRVWKKKKLYPRWSFGLSMEFFSIFSDSLRAHKKSCSSCFWLYALNSASIYQASEPPTSSNFAQLLFVLFLRLIFFDHRRKELRGSREKAKEKKSFKPITFPSYVTCGDFVWVLSTTFVHLSSLFVEGKVFIRSRHSLTRWLSLALQTCTILDSIQLSTRRCYESELRIPQHTAAWHESMKSFKSTSILDVEVEILHTIFLFLFSISLSSFVLVLHSYIHFHYTNTPIVLLSTLQWYLFLASPASRWVWNIFWIISIVQTS